MAGMIPYGGPIFAAGLKVNWAKIWRAVKLLGITAVSTSMAITEGQLAAELLKHPHRRRKKGITGRQLASARRVNRVVTNWHKSLTVSHPRAPRRSKSCK